MSAPRTRSTAVAPCRAPPPSSHTSIHFEEEDDEAGVVHAFDAGDDDSEDEEIDLDSYEAYLAEIQKKATTRPQSARTLRPYPSEAPEFYMVTTANPVAPLDLSTTTTPQPPPSRTNAQQPHQRVPTRPASARPRMNSGDDTLQGVSLPRAPQTARPSTNTATGSGGIHRKQQSPTPTANRGGPLSAHLRAAYCGAAVRGGRGRGRGGGGLSSHTASTLIQSRVRVFQDAERQHEYDRLVDVVADLRTVVQHEQTQRTKAMARVRRLEEIVVLKDKKIDALLLGLGTSHSGGDSTASTNLHREAAQRERHHHALMQKLRHKLAQQTQLVSSYENLTQTLRASVKSTRVLEMEEEVEQLQLENSGLHQTLVAQREETRCLTCHLNEAKARNTQLRTQLAKVHQDLTRSDHTRRSLEHETLFLKATMEQLEHKTRAYDQTLAESPKRTVLSTPRKSPMANSPRMITSRSSSSLSCSLSPRGVGEESTAALAEALAEMRTLRGPEHENISPKMLPVRQRRKTPMPLYNFPPSPVSSEEENLTEEEQLPTEENDKALPVDTHPLDLVKSFEAPRGAMDREKKRVHWSQNDAEDPIREVDKETSTEWKGEDERGHVGGTQELLAGSGSDHTRMATVGQEEEEEAVGQNVDSLDAPLSRTNTSDSSSASGQSGPPSSSKSSSLSGENAREEPALMAASHSDVLAYDTDFSDNESV